METLHEGQTEERSEKGITNAGLLPLNKTHYVASHWVMNNSLQAKLQLCYEKLNCKIIGTKHDTK